MRLSGKKKKRLKMIPRGETMFEFSLETVKYNRR